MPKFDVELLTIFNEIYVTGSITRASANLGLAQPTVSLALKRLREIFSDELFTRTARGMVPTPHAQGVIHDVRATLETLNRALSWRQAFDPASSRRRFNVAMTDISQIVLMPGLLRDLKQSAPHVSVEVHGITEETPRQLLDGQVDVAVGFMPQLEAGYYQQKLFDESFVCLVSGDHPRLRGPMDSQAFTKEGHIHVLSSGTGHGVVDEALGRHGVQRTIALRVPSFLGLGALVEQTDLVALVPRRLARHLAQRHRVVALATPVPLPHYAVRQHWHQRFHGDPAHQWLRQAVARSVQRDEQASPDG